MLDEPICYLRCVGSILSLYFYFLWKVLLADTVNPDQTPHYYVASDLGLECLPLSLLATWFIKIYINFTIDVGRTKFE